MFIKYLLCASYHETFLIIPTAINLFPASELPQNFIIWGTYHTSSLVLYICSLSYWILSNLRVGMMPPSLVISVPTLIPCA